jgi:CBS domain-containing protein
MSEEEATVAQIMDKNVHTVEYDVSVKDCARAMAKQKSGYAVVVRAGATLGIVTERDMVWKVIGDNIDPSEVRVSDIMSTPLISIAPSATVTEAAKLMSEYRVRRLVVIGENGGLAGIVSSINMAMSLAQKSGFSNPTLNAIARVESPTGGPYQ